MKTNFVIFGQSRSGSTLLKQLIDSHPSITCEGEIFTTTDGYLKNNMFCRVHNYLPYPYIYYRRILSSTNVYGFTLFIYHLKNIKKGVHHLHSMGWKIIYLNRQNIVDQSLSNIIAMNTRRFHRNEGQNLADSSFTIPVDKFLEEVKKRIQWCKRETDIMKSIPHFAVNYEEHLENTKAWQTTAERIFRYLGTKKSPVNSSLQTTYNKPYSKLAENYGELIDELKNHQLGYLLNWKNK